MASEGSIVPLHEFHAFVVRCMKAVGISEEHGSSLADLLVSADYRGHYSHGLNRLGEFCISNTYKQKLLLYRYKPFYFAV
jgi:LDH2 family malate/lactate/ureidoglycolate dehydrogenase